MKDPYVHDNDTRPRVVGVDLHPDSLSAAVLAGQTPRTAKVVATYDHVAIDDCEDFLQNNTRENDIIVVEASCTSSAFEELACSLQRKVIVLNSTDAAKIGKCYRKTDMIDAHLLALVYLGGACDEVCVPDAKTRSRRAVVHAHLNAVKDATQTKNRLKSYITGFGVRIGKKASVTTVAGKQKVRDSKPWSAEQLLVIETAFEDIDRADAQRRKWVSYMAQAVLKDEQMTNLMKLCGIGLIAAYNLMSVIGDIGRFSSPKKLVAYFGVNPGVRDSGEKKRRFGVGNNGRSQIRVKMVQGAQSLLQAGEAYGGKLRKWGLAMSLRKGRPIAVIAVARKMTVAVWYLLRGFHTPLLQKAEKSIRAKVARVQSRHRQRRI